MLNGELLNNFLSRTVTEHHLQLEARKLHKIEEITEYYYDIFGFTGFPSMEEMTMIIAAEEEKPVNPEWEEPHDKWPRDFDNRSKNPDEDC